MDLLTLLSEAARARASVLPDSERDCKTIDLALHSHMCMLLRQSSQDGSSLKTSPQYCPVTTGRISSDSSPHLMTAGIVYRGQFWTHNTFPWRKGGGACSLADILEDGNVPQKYFLSPTACKGILRRADRRGKTLPATLRTALETVAYGSQIPSAEPSVQAEPD